MVHDLQVCIFREEIEMRCIYLILLPLQVSSHYFEVTNSDEIESVSLSDRNMCNRSKVKQADGVPETGLTQSLNISGVKEKTSLTHSSSKV